MPWQKFPNANLGIYENGIEKGISDFFGMNCSNHKMINYKLAKIHSHEISICANQIEFASRDLYHLLLLKCSQKDRKRNYFFEKKTILPTYFSLISFLVLKNICLSYHFGYWFSILILIYSEKYDNRINSYKLLNLLMFEIQFNFYS